MGIRSKNQHLKVIVRVGDVILFHVLKEAQCSLVEPFSSVAHVL